jgi:ureidoacrylate peracid hydrolase
VGGAATLKASTDRSPIRSTLESQVAIGRVAVVVIDVQKDFCASDGVMGGAWGLDMSRIQEAVPRLNRFLERARANADTLQLIREGLDGTDWYDGVTPVADGEPVFTKWNYDAFESTDLDLWLRAHDIETLVFVGFTTNVCVETSARHAYIKGYYTIVLSDCTGAPDQAEHEAALVNIGKYFGKVATSESVVGAWAAGSVPAPALSVGPATSSRR